MNLRKFISGVSALAIAASAFAGLAVTASAASTTIDFTSLNGGTSTTLITSGVTLDNATTGIGEILIKGAGGSDTYGGAAGIHYNGQRGSSGDGANRYIQFTPITTGYLTFNVSSSSTPYIISAVGAASTAGATTIAHGETTTAIVHVTAGQAYTFYPSGAAANFKSMEFTPASAAFTSTSTAATLNDENVLNSVGTFEIHGAGGSDTYGGLDGIKFNGATSNSNRYIRFTPAETGSIIFCVSYVSSNTTPTLYAVAGSEATGGSLIATANASNYMQRTVVSNAYPVTAGETYTFYVGSSGMKIMSIYFSGETAHTINFTTLANASVTVDGDTANPIQADENGDFTADLVNGSHSLVVSKDGYFDKTFNVTVTSGEADKTVLTDGITQLYTVTYDVSGISTYEATYSGATSVTVGQDAKPASAPTITDTGAQIGGYAFLGWSSDGGSTIVSPTATAVTGDTTYTPVFSAQIKRSAKYYPSADSSTSYTTTEDTTLAIGKTASRAFMSFDSIDTQNAVSATMNIYPVSGDTLTGRVVTVGFYQGKKSAWNNMDANAVVTNQSNGDYWYSDTRTGHINYTAKKAEVKVDAGSNADFNKPYSGRFTSLDGITKLIAEASLEINLGISSIEGSNPEYIEVFYTDGYSVKFGDAAAVEYAQDDVINIPDPGEGFVWSDGTTTYVSGASYTVTRNVTFTKQATAPAGPSAEVTGVSYNKYEGGAFDGDAPITAAKVFVEVTGTITKLGLRYNKGTAETPNWTAAQYASAIDTVLTGGNILLGAIVPGQVELTTSSFDAVID